jgi:hypothetical protein
MSDLTDADRDLVRLEVDGPIALTGRVFTAE